MSKKTRALAQRSEYRGKRPYHEDVRAREVATMPEQVAVLTSILLSEPKVRIADFGGEYVRVNGRQFLRLYLLAARQSLQMARVARRNAVRAVGSTNLRQSLRRLLSGALRKWARAIKGPDSELPEMSPLPVTQGVASSALQFKPLPDDDEAP